MGNAHPNTTEASADLAARVTQFNMMQLPGQPFGMHMGTSYLVNDLAADNTRLRADNTALVAANALLMVRENEARDGLHVARDAFAELAEWALQKPKGVSPNVRNAMFADFQRQRLAADKALGRKATPNKDAI